MKKAVAHLLPYIEEAKKKSGGGERENAGVIIMATVKGDVYACSSSPTCIFLCTP